MAKTAPIVESSDMEDLFSRYSKHAEFIGEEITEVTQPGLFGSQILHLAAFSNRVEDVALSIAGGADINVTGDLGLSPLHYAVLGGSAEVALFLMARLQVNSSWQLLVGGLEAEAARSNFLERDSVRSKPNSAYHRSSGDWG